MRVYLAGPLFTEAERAWLTALKQRIEAGGIKGVVIWLWELFSDGEVE